MSDSESETHEVHTDHEMDDVEAEEETKPQPTNHRNLPTHRPTPVTFHRTTVNSATQGTTHTYASQVFAWAAGGPGADENDIALLVSLGLTDSIS